MSDEKILPPSTEKNDAQEETVAHSDYRPANVRDGEGNLQLTGMYQN